MGVPIAERIRMAALLAVAGGMLVAAHESRGEVIGPPPTPSITVGVEGVPSQWGLMLGATHFTNRPGSEHARKLVSPIPFEGILNDHVNLEVVNLEYDPDPFVLNNVVITNPTATTQTYTVGISLPTVFPGPSFISGTVLVGVIDGNDDGGATVATAAGFPIYAAQIDFVTVATLLDDPTSIVMVGSGPPANASDVFGPVVHAGAVTANIGIQLRFSLTAGDTASILSRFDVVAIPEPATVGVLLLGGVALLRRPMRRDGAAAWSCTSGRRAPVDRETTDVSAPAR